MVDTRQAYNNWSEQYESNLNRTRDLEAIACRELLASIAPKHALEIGCGTGKNTLWLAGRAEKLTAVDLSEEMLARAREKMKSAANVEFIQGDITRTWPFLHASFDLVSFSLVLEHLESLEAVFENAASALLPGGYLYLGELPPFKQYSGSKARYETAEGVQVLTCFTHHLSDFTEAGRRHGLRPLIIREYFDENNRESLPRILALLFQKA